LAYENETPGRLSAPKVRAKSSYQALVCLGNRSARIRTLRDCWSQDWKASSHAGGNGLVGERFWIVAEHGRKSGYVRNMASNPGVRLKVRVGLRAHWYEGTALHRPVEMAALIRRWCRNSAGVVLQGLYFRRDTPENSWLKIAVARVELGNKFHLFWSNVTKCR